MIIASVRPSGFAFGYLSAAMLMAAGGAWGGLPLETETARLLPRGVCTINGAFELQTSASGREIALPLAFEYGIRDGLEFLVEPVPYTSIRPHGGSHTNGPGDLETTLTGLLIRERGSRPAIAIAGEVKFPTATDRMIGSGKADFTTYLIGSKQIGRFDGHLNVGYTWVGSPRGVHTKKVFDYAAAEELRLSNRCDLVGEIFGSTSALPEGVDPSEAGGESSLTPEIGGGETVGSLGARYRARSGITVSMGISYDNNAALLLSPGVTIEF